MLLPGRSFSRQQHPFPTIALGMTQTVHNGTQTSLVRNFKGTIVTERAGIGRYNPGTDYQGSVVRLVSTTGALAASFKDDPYGGSMATGASVGDNRSSDRVAREKKFAWWPVVTLAILAVASICIALAVPGAEFMQYVAIGLFVGAVSVSAGAFFSKGRT